MRDQILGVAVLVSGIAMAWLAIDYVAPISYEPVGPRSFPWLLAGLLMVVGLVLLVRASVAGNTGSLSAAEREARRILPLPVVILLAAILVYGLTFQWLGFPIATALLSIVIGRLFGANWQQAIIAGIGFGLGLYLLFDKVLDVVLPVGLLRSVL